MMKRQQFIILPVLTLCVLLIGLIASVSAVSYTDIGENYAKEQINDLANQDIIDGYGDNTFRPDNLITRAEFSNILVKAFDLEDTEVSGIYFIDVKPSDWYYKPVTILKKLSIVDGYDNKNFKPNTNITRAEMLTAIVRVNDNLKLSSRLKEYKDISTNNWAYSYINSAYRAGIIYGNSSYLKPNEYVKRAEIAYSVDKALWNTKSSGVFNYNGIVNQLNQFSSQLNQKYNLTDSNIDDLKGQVFGGELSFLDIVSRRNALYEKLGVKINRNLILSNSRVSLMANNLVKVTYNYNLTTKMFIRNTNNSSVKNGMLSYFLKNVNNDWLIYSQEETINTQTLGKLNLVWDYEGKSSDKFAGGKIEGLDVISPTWFSINSAQGNIESKANKNYVTNAHELGYQVWGLVNNDFDQEITNSILNNTAIRQKVIDKLVEYAVTYDLDGINIDFENMYTKDKSLFTEFVNELSLKLKPKGILLSVDVTVKSQNSSWSGCYERDRLAKIADYIAVMTYDQYWSTSPVSGSTAQLSWVENSIKNLLSEIPSDKLLLGLPFYTRDWSEVNGAVIKSEAISMAEADKRRALYGGSKVWDNESGQYYIEYANNGVTHKIWLEDETSIDLKSKLVNKYDLGGVASWQYGQEKKSIWEILKKNLK